MKIDLKFKKKQICETDIVEYKNQSTCMVAYIEDDPDGYYYKLIDLKTGHCMDEYTCLDSLNDSSSVELVAKGDQVKIEWI